MLQTKLEASDLSAYDWAWWDTYGPEVLAELELAFTASILQAAPDLAPTVAQQLAQKYALDRASALLQVTGDINIIDLTQARVQQLVAATIEEGGGLGELAKKLREDYAFSASRAEAIARTETGRALSQGTLGAARQQGRDQKSWITQGDDRVEEECLANEGAGWIGIDEQFPSGQDGPPAHARCRCALLTRTSSLHEEAVRAVIAEARCPDCGKLLARNVVKMTTKCPRCKIELTFDVKAAATV